jgi:prepilin-type N-terminal cleavage/methylation domain-containing protein
MFCSPPQQGRKAAGFTLIEVMVVITIIALLAGVGFYQFNEGRKVARDSLRQSMLREMQIALEVYRVQHGRYPAACASSDSNFNGAQFGGGGPHTMPLVSCDPNPYIQNLAPTFITAMLADPIFEDQNNRGFVYRTNQDGTGYKLMAYQVVESETVTSPNHPFARCPLPHLCHAGSEHWCFPDSGGNYPLDYQTSYAVFGGVGSGSGPGSRPPACW